VVGCAPWAPRGQAPVLQYHFNWKVLSAAAGITWWNFYFRLYQDTIHAVQTVDFLGHLRHLPSRAAGNLGPLQNPSQPWTTRNHKTIIAMIETPAR
jgi:hypothetical protein